MLFNCGLQKIRGKTVSKVTGTPETLRKAFVTISDAQRTTWDGSPRSSLKNQLQKLLVSVSLKFLTCINI